jgi:hypothetical protein
MAPSSAWRQAIGEAYGIERERSTPKSTRKRYPSSVVSSLHFCARCYFGASAAQRCRSLADHIFVQQILGVVSFMHVIAHADSTLYTLM